MCMSLLRNADVCIISCRQKFKKFNDHLSYVLPVSIYFLYLTQSRRFLQRNQFQSHSQELFCQLTSYIDYTLKQKGSKGPTSNNHTHYLKKKTLQHFHVSVLLFGEIQLDHQGGKVKMSLYRTLFPADIRFRASNITNRTSKPTKITILYKAKKKTSHPILYSCDMHTVFDRSCEPEHSKENRVENPRKL